MADRSVERREVVTSFVRHRGQILILQRSNRVRTMRGRWAGVSGYREGQEDVIARALQEIREELSLPPDAVRLVARGEVVEAPDLRDPNLIWVVHPLLFESGTDHIQLDWEHTAYRWIAPQDLHSYATVPRLSEALDSVLAAEAGASGERVVEGRNRRLRMKSAELKALRARTSGLGKCSRCERRQELYRLRDERLCLDCWFSAAHAAHHVETDAAGVHSCRTCERSST